MAAEKTAKGTVRIERPAIERGEVTVRGDAPYVQLRFSQKQKNKLKEEHAADQREEAGKRGKPRTPKDYDALYEEAMYRAEGGARGLNAMSFKRAMVAACRLTKLDMLRAKMCIFVLPDGYDEFQPEIPLVFFTKGEPYMHDSTPRNANKLGVCCCLSF